MIKYWFSSFGPVVLQFVPRTVIVHSEARLFLCKELHSFYLSLGCVNWQHPVAHWSWPIVD